MFEEGSTVIQPLTLVDDELVTPGRADSVEKLVHKLALLSPEPVRWGPKQKVLVKTPPKQVLVAPSVFREFICTVGCTACCYVTITLDYFPGETQFAELPSDVQKQFKVRDIYVNGRLFPIISHDRRHLVSKCQFLTESTRGGGPGCGLWPRPPLECQAAPQSQLMQIRPGKTYLLKKPFSRAWRFKQKPQCQFVANQDLSLVLAGDIAILRRYLAWASFLNMPTDLIHSLIDYLEGVLGQWRPVPRTSMVVWKRNRELALPLSRP